MPDIIDETIPKDIDLVGLGAGNIRDTRVALNDLNDAIADIGAKLEYIEGSRVETTKHADGHNLGVLQISQGVINVGTVAVQRESLYTIPILADLTASVWCIVYCATDGSITVEETSDSTSMSIPTAVLDIACPYEDKLLARYKAGDATKRAIAIAYTLPTQVAWDGGTADKMQDTVLYNNIIYVALKDGTNKQPDTETIYWAVMGTQKRLFLKTVQIKEEIQGAFGRGLHGDAVLDCTVLGATATPLYEQTVVDQYEFNNLTITGTCFCGQTSGADHTPVVIRVKGTLTIGASGVLNGTTRGRNGGAGGAGGGGGGAGGAGGKSGRPIHIYANKIVNLRASGSYWLETIGGAGATGAGGGATNGLGLGGAGGGGGGGGGGGIVTGGGAGGGGGGSMNTSGIIVISNSNNIKEGINNNITPIIVGGDGGDIRFGLSKGGGLGSGLYGTIATSSQNAGGGGGGVSGGGVGGDGGGIGGAGGTGGFGGGGGGGGGTSNGSAGSAFNFAGINLNYVLIIDRFYSREAI